MVFLFSFGYVMTFVPLIIITVFLVVASQLFEMFVGSDNVQLFCMPRNLNCYKLLSFFQVSPQFFDANEKSNVSLDVCWQHLIIRRKFKINYHLAAAFFC